MEDLAEVTHRGVDRVGNIGGDHSHPELAADEALLRVHGGETGLDVSRPIPGVPMDPEEGRA